MYTVDMNLLGIQKQFIFSKNSFPKNIGIFLFLPTSRNIVLNLNLKFYLAYIQHNTSDTEHMLKMNARTPVITKIVDATGRPLKL